jgi:hypothetical protein
MENDHGKRMKDIEFRSGLSSRSVVSAWGNVHQGV